LAAAANFLFRQTIRRRWEDHVTLKIFDTDQFDATLAGDASPGDHTSIGDGRDNGRGATGAELKDCREL
jgi:hypothetical protein